MNAVIYETFQHIIPTGEGWCRGLTDVGVNCFALPSGEHALSDIDEYIDFAVILSSVDPACFDDIINYKKSNPHTKICMVVFNYRPEYDKLLGIIDVWIEIVHKHDHALKEFNKRGQKLIFVPLAADEHKFYPTTDAKVYDVSFLGTLASPGEREEDTYLFPVIDKGYPGFFAGFSYKGLKAQECFNHKLVNIVYNKTKVNLNFHYPYQKGEIEGTPITRNDFNGRVYEIAMSGNFQICDHPSVADHFMGGIPYVPKDKWLEALDYYLVHEDERTAMAAIARKIALKDHTWKRRMEQFLEQI